MRKLRLADFSPLSPAENQIVSELSHGGFDRLGDGLVPVEPDPARLVGADFLRFILLGGDEHSRPPEKGIRVSGGWIKGVLVSKAAVSPETSGEGLNLEPNLIFSRGGLDANWLDKHGIPTVTIGAGQREVHTIKEYVVLSEYAEGCRLAVLIATGV